jgi:hypothetical protein
LLKGLAKPTTDELQKFAMSMSDAVVKASPKLGKTLETALKAQDKPVLTLNGSDLVTAHSDLYQEVLEEALV